MSPLFQSYPPEPMNDHQRSNNQLLTIPQVLHHLGVCRATFYKIVKGGDLAIVKLGGASRVRATDLQQYVDQLPELHAEVAK